MKVKKFLKIFVSILLLAGFCWLAYTQIFPVWYGQYLAYRDYSQETYRPPAKIDPNIPIEEQTRRIQLGPHTLDLPIMYLKLRLSKGDKQDIISLVMQYPNMRSFAELSREEFTAAKSNNIPNVHVLIQDAALVISPEVMSSREKRTYDLRFKEKEYDLTKYTEWNDVKDIPFSEIYFEGTEGQETGFFHCDINERIGNPGCRYNFYFDDLYFSVAFNKRYLHDWKNIKEKITDLYLSFKVQNSL
ncbi:MAG: hypothetical protein R3D66_02600 [Alphaproteobacteria bacterium]